MGRKNLENVIIPATTTNNKSNYGNNTKFRSLDNGHVPYHRDTRTDRIDIGRILTNKR